MRHISEYVKVSIIGNDVLSVCCDGAVNELIIIRVRPYKVVMVICRL